MGQIKIAIEADRSAEAAQDLLAIPGLSGSIETPAEPKKTEGLTTVATIVGIVAGSLQVAEQIRRYYIRIGGKLGKAN